MLFWKVDFFLTSCRLMSRVKPGKGSPTCLEVLEEHSSPVFPKFGAENCLGYLTFSAFVSYVSYSF